MRLALIGDIHMYRLLVPPWELAGKALVGHANVWLNRRRHFERELIGSMAERVVALKPDLVLFVGDLTSIGVMREFRRLAGVLRPMLTRVKAIMVPGNHDRYTFLATQRRRMERAFPGHLPEAYPALSDLTEGWKLLAIDTAVPRLWSSRGRAGKEQLARAREIVTSLPSGTGLLVLAHYALGTPPPMPEMRFDHQLEDRDAMLDVLRACPGPVLFVHGHVHVPWSWHREDASGLRVLDINTGAPVLCDDDMPFGQGFWELELPQGPARLENVLLTRHRLLNDPEPGPAEWKTERVASDRVEIEAENGR